MFAVSSECKEPCCTAETLHMNAADSFETSVRINISTRRHTQGTFELRITRVIISLSCLVTKIYNYLFTYLYVLSLLKQLLINIAT